MMRNTGMVRVPHWVRKVVGQRLPDHIYDQHLRLHEHFQHTYETEVIKYKRQFGSRIKESLLGVVLL